MIIIPVLYVSNNLQHIFDNTIGVRGGGAGGATAPPNLFHSGKSRWIFGQFPQASQLVDIRLKMLENNKLSSLKLYACISNKLFLDTHNVGRKQKEGQ